MTYPPRISVLTHRWNNESSHFRVILPGWLRWIRQGVWYSLASKPHNYELSVPYGVGNLSVKRDTPPASRLRAPYLKR